MANVTCSSSTGNIARKAQPCIQDDDDRQADSRKIYFLNNIRVVQKHCLAARVDFRKQIPAQDASAKVNAVCEAGIYFRQFTSHDLGEYYGVNQDHRQGIEDGPGRAQQGIPVPRPEFTLDAPENKTAVSP